MNSNIIIALMNKEKNKEILDMIPHREVLDLAVVYRRVIAAPDGEFYDILIENDMMKDLGLTETELYDLARENTRRIMPYTLENIDGDCYMLTNKYHLFGSVASFESDELEKLAERCGKSLYVLPATVHGMVAVPDTGQETGYVKKIVEEANQFVPNLKFYLSDKVYYFDLTDKKIKIVPED